MENGSIASITIQTKPSGKKSMLAINLDKLESSAEVEEWRAYWKQFGQ